VKKFISLLVTGITVLLVAALIPAVIAQEGEIQDVGAGEGGIIIYGNTADDPATFNPIISSDTSSSDVIQWLYPAIIGLNYETGLEEPNVPGALAESWEFDESGTVLTIHLREGLTWNDGTPITSADYIYAAEAIRSGQTSSPRTYVFETLVDGTETGGKVVNIEAPDANTVVVTFSQPDCIAFSDVNDIPMVPAHVFSELYGDNYAAMDEDPRAIPTVTWGPFKDIEFAPSERISMIADQSYSDALLGYVAPEEWVYLSVPDENVETERFIGGEITVLAVPAVRQNDFRTDPELAEFQTYEFSGNSFVFMAMNNADPANPQPGLDDEGNPLPQTPHPVLGDPLVRQAVTQAVDMNALIDGIRDGNGVPIATHTIPTSWAFNPDLQYQFDPEAASALLDEAGWVDDDGDPSTPRVCQNCLYAREVDPDFEGAPLDIRVRVPAGGVVGEQMGEFIAASLEDVGFATDFQAIDWATAFLPELDGQTFDMAMLSWNLGLPVDPDVAWAYGPEADLPGSGFNFVSFYNEELNQIMEAARDPGQTNGCDTETRRQMYLRAQEILYEEAPYLYMYVPESMTATQPNLGNWNPTPYSRTYDTDAWALLGPVE
jgi:peptide/nickel transport system substrate-binding protein